MTRDAILEAAAQSFRKKGFHGTSMADIAQAVQLQKASLYHHVASKQEILLELLERALRPLTAQMSAIAAEALPADLKLRKMMRVYLQSLAENPDLSAVLLFEYRSLERKYRLKHQPLRDAFEIIWRDVIADGVRTGMFVCGDVNMASRALMGLMNWTLTWYRPDGPLSAETIADHYSDMFFHGLLKE